MIGTGVETLTSEGSISQTKDGHHVKVDETQVQATETVTTIVYAFDSTTTTKTINGSAATATTQTQYTRTDNSPTTATQNVGELQTKLSGGELDTTTMIDFGPGFGVQAAHTFNTTNGVTTAADYSDPTASVVDYTPRMITQTVSSSCNQPELALERLGIATDTATYDIVGANDVVTPGYTENFIENTNSYAADPSYSGWFVLFGQFFDHGLDFVSKPGGGPTIQIALAVDDPLYGKIGPDGQPTTSITLNRAAPEPRRESRGGAGTGREVRHGNEADERSRRRTRYAQPHLALHRPEPELRLQ